MKTAGKKIRGDIRQHRLQIGLIGLVLLLGSAGVVAALNARAILQREIARSYQQAHSPDLVLWFDRVDARLLDAVRAQPGVAAVDARRIASTRVAGRNGAWLPMRLLVLRDFSAQSVGLVHQHAGPRPAPDRGILIEQSSLPLLGVPIGDPLRVRTPGGGTVSVPVTGTVHDTAVAPSTQDRVVYAYVTPAIAAQLGQNPELDQLTVLLEDRNGIADQVTDLRQALAKINQPPIRADVLPNTHPHAALMTTMLRVLGVMAGMAFTCSAALAAFVVSLWMKREVRQVGIMKTMGATSGQLAGLYLALVGPLVLLATALALPLGTGAGRLLVRYYETNLNIDVTDWTAPPGLILGEMLGALGIPFLAMAGPIIRAARLRAHAAISDPGITAQTAPRRLAAKLIKVPGSRQWTFALRNSFRRPWRLAITLLALATGGTLFLTGENLYASLMHVVDLSLANQGHDLEVMLPRAVAASQLENLARGIPGVEIAEAWRRSAVGVTRSDQTAAETGEARRFPLTAFPPDTRLRKLPIKEGRWPRPEETDAIVVTRLVQSELPGLRLDSELVLHSGDHHTKVRVVGLVEEVASPVIYTTFAAYEAIIGLGTVSTDLRVKTSQLESVVPALDQALLDARIYVGQMQTRADIREVLDEHFLVVVAVGKMIALAVALLGAICLAAFACLNVLERSREIGVIRTLGATPGTVTAILLAESGALAGLSAALAVGFSVVATQALNDLTARSLLHVAVPLVVSRPALGVLAGGIFVVLLGVGLPLRRLLRRPVREVLAYE